MAGITACTVLWLIIPPLATIVAGVWFASRLPNDARAKQLGIAIWSRCTAEGTAMMPADQDRAVVYFERIIDRLINKCRGILPFNSLLMALINLERTRIPTDMGLASPVMIVLGEVLFALTISSLMCLSQFLVRWGHPTEYEQFESEVMGSASVVARRSRTIEWATVLSFAALIGLVCVIVVLELR